VQRLTHPHDSKFDERDFAYVPHVKYVPRDPSCDSRESNFEETEVWGSQNLVCFSLNL
jgi:hypothetical protein